MIKIGDKVKITARRKAMRAQQGKEGVIEDISWGHYWVKTDSCYVWLYEDEFKVIK